MTPPNPALERTRGQAGCPPWTPVAAGRSAPGRWVARGRDGVDL
jgi:hypothetical protein